MLATQSMLGRELQKVDSVPRTQSPIPSAARRCLKFLLYDQTRFEPQALGARVADKTLVGRAADGAQANRLRHLVPHLRDAAARNDDGHAHLGRLDDHLAGEAAGGVEDKAFRPRIRG